MQISYQSKWAFMVCKKWIYKEVELKFIYALHQLAKFEYIYSTRQHWNMAACIKNQERTCVVQILGEYIPLEDQQIVSIYKKKQLQFQGQAYQFLYFLHGKQKHTGCLLLWKWKCWFLWIHYTVNALLFFLVSSNSN